MRLISLSVAALSALSALASFASAGPDSVSILIPRLLDDSAELSDIAFSNVVHAATGKRVIPLNPTDPVDAELLARIGRAMESVLGRLNATNSAAQAKRRINEVSAVFENAIRSELNAVEGFQGSNRELYRPEAIVGSSRTSR